MSVKSGAAIAAGIAALMAGAYLVGTTQGQKAAPAAKTESALPATTTAAGDHADAAAIAGAQRAGTHAIDPNAKFTHYNVGNSNVKSIYIDGKFVWVGTSNGVIRYDTSNDQYKLFDTRTGLLSNGIFWVGKLGDRMAVGTYGGGMSIFHEEKEQWENVNIADGLGDAFVYGALKAANGDVWIATWSGANLVQGGEFKNRSKWKTFTVKSTNGGLPNDWVYGLAQGKNGEIWMATEGGLARYKDGQWQNWNHKQGLGADIEIVKNDPQFGNDPAAISKHHANQKNEMGLSGVNVAYNPNYIISLQIDSAGGVWCGTWGGGLAHFDGKTWHNFTMKDGLPGNHVFSLHYDAEGILWVGTNNGLARYDGQSFKNYTTADGLFAENVFSMATDTNRTRWIGSYGGVSRMTGL